MGITRRSKLSLIAAVAVMGTTLLAPAVTTTATAMPPCCGITAVTTYYATADMTSIVGQYGDPAGDCPFTSWGDVTPYYKTSFKYCVG